MIGYNIFFFLTSLFVSFSSLLNTQMDSFSILIFILVICANQSHITIIAFNSKRTYSKIELIPIEVFSLILIKIR